MVNFSTRILLYTCLRVSYGSYAKGLKSIIDVLKRVLIFIRGLGEQCGIRVLISAIDLYGYGYVYLVNYLCLCD